MFRLLHQVRDNSGFVKNEIMGNNGQMPTKVVLFQGGKNTVKTELVRLFSDFLIVKDFLKRYDLNNCIKRNI